MPRATIEAEAAAETNPDNGKAFLAITVGCLLFFSHFPGAFRFLIYGKALILPI